MRRTTRKKVGLFVQTQQHIDDVLDLKEAWAGLAPNAHTELQRWADRIIETCAAIASKYPGTSHAELAVAAGDEAQWVRRLIDGPMVQEDPHFVMLQVGRLAAAEQRLNVNLALHDTVESRRSQSAAHSRNAQTANQRRAGDADRSALEHFDQWQRRVRAALRGDDGEPLDAAGRVKKYLSTRQVRTDRKKRRIRALLKRGLIPDLR